MQQSVSWSTQEVADRKKKAYSRSNGCRNIENDAHDRVEIEDHEDTRKGVGHERDEEVNKTVGEDHLSESACGGHRSRARRVAVDSVPQTHEFVTVEQQDDEVECHGVYEGGSKNGIVRR